MKKILFAVAAFIGVGLLFTNCTKTVHDSSDGSGSQALTELFTIKASDWQGSNGNYTYGVNLSSFDQDIHDNGAYWAYISFDNGASYELLSTSNNIYTFYATFDKDPNSSAYGVTIQAIGSSTDPAPNMSILIKVVSIPSSMVQQTANVDFKDYNQVKRVFNLK
ncbi:hypothetical protein [Arachidicoccus sp.]|uniref:hypothetical protein n=1 Tax=Arachidicoccus sp. TaxID=1872624 RepID=UPI003D211987